MTRPTSVVTTDQDALRHLLDVHAPQFPKILDVTHNKGRMWRGLPWFHPHRMDSDHELHAQGHTDTVGDFTAMPFPDASFDVVVFDPPHITDAGHGIVGVQQWADRYGTLTTGRKLNINHLFAPFLAEAKRVLVPGGIVLAKLADQTHGNAYQWQHVAFINAAEAAGMTACDLALKVRKSGMIDPKWRNVYHLRKVHTYWLVVRNGAHCVRRVASRPASVLRESQVS